MLFHTATMLETWRVRPVISINGKRRRVVQTWWTMLKEKGNENRIQTMSICSANSVQHLQKIGKCLFYSKPKKRRKNRLTQRLQSEFVDLTQKKRLSWECFLRVKKCFLCVNVEQLVVEMITKIGITCAFKAVFTVSMCTVMCTFVCACLYACACACVHVRVQVRACVHTGCMLVSQRPSGAQLLPSLSSIITFKEDCNSNYGNPSWTLRKVCWAILHHRLLPWWQHHTTTAGISIL